MPAPAYTTAKFGARALPGTSALQAWVDFVNGGSWSPADFQVGDSQRALGEGRLLFRGRGVWLSDDFGGRQVVIPALYKELTSPLSSALATLSQAGEQYLTFDTQTYLSVKYSGFASRTLRRKFSPIWWKGQLVFRAVDPWAKDFQASGSLANLLNPSGGFEVAGAAVSLFLSIGTDAKEGAALLTDWTIDAGAPTKAANVVTMPASAQMRAGHADWTDLTNVQARFVWSTNSQPYLLLHAAASNSWVRVRADGANLHLDKDLAGVATNDVTAAVAAVLTNGTTYWLTGSIVGTTFVGKVQNNNAGVPGTTIATVTLAIADAAVQSGMVGLGNNGAASCTFGAAAASVFLVQGDGKGWTVNDVGTVADVAFCMSKTSPQAGTFSGSITTVNASSNGYWSLAFTAAAATYAYRGFLKASGAGVASLNLGGTGLQSVTQDSTWRQTTDATLALGAGANTVRCQLNGVGTAYFDNLTLQQCFDAATGLYSQTFVDQVALGGSSGAGTQTVFTITYPGGIWVEPLWRITLPSTKGAAVSSITIVNQTTGVGLTFAFSPTLAAGSLQTLDIDCALLAAIIGSTQYDWTPPVGAKTGFPVLWPGVNQIAVTVVTASGTTTGVTLDTNWRNRWEL